MKIKANNTVLLTACVVILALLCFLSVDSPMRFQRQCAKREKVVRQQIDTIKAAEAKYFAKHHSYSGSLDALVKEGFLSDEATYIPYSDNERFTLRATIGEGRGGRQQQRVVCSAGYEQYLHGLDKSSVSNLIEKANEEDRFPGVTSTIP